MKNFFFLLLFSALVVGCGDDDDGSVSGGSSSSPTAVVYKGAINVPSKLMTPSSNLFTLSSILSDVNVGEWSISLNSSASTFTVTGPSSLTVTGTYSTLSSGLLKLTVSTSSSPSPSPGDEAYGLLIDGLVFFLKPMEADSGIIPMLVSGTCPSSNFTMNWVVTSKNSDLTQCEPEFGGNKSGLDITGTATFDLSASTVELSNRWDICGNDMRCSLLNEAQCGGAGGCTWNGASCDTNSGAMTFSCDEGVATIVDGDENVQALVQQIRWMMGRVMKDDKE